MVVLFSRVSERIPRRRGFILEQNLNMNGEFIAVVGNKGLSEVDLMPTPDGRVLHS